MLKAHFQVHQLKDAKIDFSLKKKEKKRNRDTFLLS